MIDVKKYKKHLQEILPFNQLHHDVETSVILEGIVDLWQMLVLYRKKDTDFSQSSPACRWTDIIRLFNRTEAVIFTGVITTINSTKAAAIDERINNNRDEKNQAFNKILRNVGHVHNGHPVE